MIEVEEVKDSKAPVAKPNPRKRGPRGGKRPLSSKAENEAKAESSSEESINGTVDL